MSQRIKFLLKILSCLSLFYFLPIFSLTPEGYWGVINNDISKTLPIGIVKISKFNGTLIGQFIRFTPINGKLDASCPECQAFLKKQPIAGPILMCNYRETRNGSWVGGKIYNSKTAEIYNSTLKLSDDGNTLYVIGKLGPFWRTSTWIRIPAGEIEKQ